MSDHQLHRSAVVLFTKPPRAGKVKTRLIGELSAEQAAELHGAFLADTVDSLSRGDFELHLAWALDGADGSGPDGKLPSRPASSFRQQGGDLGERMFHGLRRAAARHPRVAAVGSDSPELDATTVEDAFLRLAAGADVVIGPTRDGGYYLIALDRAALRRELFEGVAWSTESVLADTLARCRELGLRVELLPVIEDVDVAEDLRLLAERLSTGGRACARTAALLAAWGRLPAPAEVAQCES